MLESVTEWFWWDRLWLPGNLTWSHLEDHDGLVYAKPSHLYAALPCALVLLLARYLFERYVGDLLANVLGIRDAVRLTAEPNHVLEQYFHHQTRAPSQADVSSLCKKTSWSERRVQIWFRRRRNQGRPGLRKKFREASWRCAFYFFAFIGGILAVYDKPWFYNLREVWVGFPKQSMLPSQYWYYLIEMGFYLSLLLSLTCDVKRKDFMEQVLHHLATLTLLGFSWISNYIRVGTLVMATHDSADIFLEGSKMLFYLKWKLSANVIFMVFTLLFILTRLVILPFWLIHCTWVYPPEFYPPFFGYYFFNAMLFLLQILHLYWAVLIAQMLYKSFCGKLEGDERSDEEEDESEEEEHESDALEKRNNGLSDKNAYGVRSRANGQTANDKLRD